MNTSDVAIKYEIQVRWKLDNFFKKIQSDTCKRFSLDGNDKSKGNWNLIVGDFSMKLVIILPRGIEPEETATYRFIVEILKLDGSYFYNHEEFFFKTGEVFSLALPEKEKFLASEVDITRNRSLTIYIRVLITPYKEIEFPISVRKNQLQETASQTNSIECVQTLSKDFKDLLDDGCHTDVKIKVGGKEFPAHKCVLAARSKVFTSMFSQQMLENINGVATINDCDSDTFQDFLTFLYSGKLDGIVSSRIVGLYEIADKYENQELKEECVKHCIIEMSVDSMCDALRIAALHDEKELMETATNFFVANTQAALKSSEWHIFLKEYPSVANELFFKSFTALNPSKTAT